LSLIKIVIADDEKTARIALKRSLIKKHIIFEAENGEQAINLVKDESPDILLLDINMPKKSGFEVLEEISNINKSIICIIMTAYGSERIAVEALKKGAWNYIAKPFQLDELRTLIGNASKQIFLQRENQKLKNDILKEKSTLLGQSQIMNEVRNLIEKISKTDVTVLIMGESGTGKEIAAHSIHNQSIRRDKPFIAINCSALPKDLIESELFGSKKGSYTGAIKDTKGKFELAHGGTLFLDEIGEMTIDTQVKLLRVLEEKAVTPIGGEKKISTDIRIIAATNVNLKNAIRKGRFREDLYYRLSVVEITMPSLRDHLEDLPLLFHYFTKLFCSVYSKPKLKVTQKIIEKSKSYDWPGNVRELKNIIENTVVLSDEILDEYILFSRINFSNQRNYSLNGRSFKDAKQEYLQPIEEALVMEALDISNQNITKAAEILGMKRQYLQQKIKSLNLN
tara:strand:+ start:5881 stop:7236 length:1356 start_codon:yes stop_codon:yes gene_type:complete